MNSSAETTIPHKLKVKIVIAAPSALDHDTMCMLVIVKFCAHLLNVASHSCIDAIAVVYVVNPIADALDKFKYNSRCNS